MTPDSEANSGKHKLKVRDADAPSSSSGKSKRASKSSKPSGKPPSRDGSSRKKSASRLFALEDWVKWLLAIVVMLSPWWFGSVSALPQFLLTGVVVICLAIWFVKCLTQRETYRPHLISLLVLVFLIVGLVQQTNLPEKIAERVAEKQLEIRESLALQLEKNHKELATSLRGQKQVAINPSAARYQFSYFVLLSAAFFLGSRFFFRRREILILATVLAINGGVIAVFGAFQKVADPNQIYGQTLEFGGVPFGPFVNRNNAAGYLLMCLACGLSVLVYSFSTFHPKRQGSRSGLSKEGFWHGVARDFQAIIAGLNAQRIGLLALCGCIAAGVFITLSRGGMISLSVAVALFALFLFRMKSRRGMILLILFLVPTAAVTLVVSGMNENVGKRLSTLNDDDLMSTELRLKLWKDSLRVMPDYPVLGSGVGSYPYIYKEYQTFVDEKWCFHAENVFVEILVTFGIVGAILLAVALMTVLLFVRSLSKSSSDSRIASPKSIAIGGLMLFVLVSQLVSNFFDFGLLIPSNGLVFIVLMGALTGAWCSRIEQDKRNNPRRLSRMPRWTTAPIILVMILLSARAGLSFWQVHNTEVANRAARTNDVNKLSKKEVNELISGLESVLDDQPNLQTHEYLAQLYVLRLQHEFVDQQIADLKKQNPPISLERDLVWERSSLRMLNFQLAEMSQEDRSVQVNRLMQYDFFKSNVQSATNEYQRALAACPLSVRSLIGLAELAYFNDCSVDGYLAAIDKYNIRRPEHLMRIGNFAVAHGKEKVAARYWKLAINDRESLFEAIVPTGIYFLNSAQVREELLPPKPSLLDQVARQYYSDPEQFVEREKLYERIVEILSRDVYPDADSNYLLGKAHMETGNIVDAIKSYEAATGLDPLKDEWTAELAELYYQVGRRKDAVEAYEKCVRLDPANQGYRQKLAVLINSEIE